MPVWPGSRGIRLIETMRLESGASANVSRLDCDVHVGTHVDAPLHYLEDGKSLDRLSLDILIGPAVVAYLPELDVITADTLDSIELPDKTKRLLLRTRNSDLMLSQYSDFREDYTALTADAAQWVVDKEIQLIGIDYLSIQCFHDSRLTHEILLKEDVVVLEGLVLCDVDPAEYRLICLPIRLMGSDGAPARVVLST
jgi:arylformamidase